MMEMERERERETEREREIEREGEMKVQAMPRRMLSQQLVSTSGFAAVATSGRIMALRHNIVIERKTSEREREREGEGEGEEERQRRRGRGGEAEEERKREKQPAGQGRCLNVACPLWRGIEGRNKEVVQAKLLEESRRHQAGVKKKSKNRGPCRHIYIYVKRE